MASDKHKDMFEESVAEKIGGKSTADRKSLIIDSSTIMIDVVRLPIMENCLIMSHATEHTYDNSVSKIILTQCHKTA